MKSKSGFIILTAGIILLFVVALIAYGGLGKMYSPQVTGTKTPVKTELDKAPDFTVTDITGAEKTLSSMKGKAVVINFWASWCPPCKGELPDFERLYREMNGEIEFMIVDMTDGVQETVEKGKAHIDENGYTFPVYYDTNMSAAMGYNVTSIPQTYFVDKEGNIAGKINGMTDYETVKSYIEKLN